MRYLGFGFGPIQSGLMLYEASRSGNFDHFTVVEVDKALVKAIRENGSRYTLNIAMPDKIRQESVENVTALDSTDPADLDAVKREIALADEMSTALPSVAFYTRGKPSVAELLRESLDEAKNRILYASENHNHAAEILIERLKASAVPPVHTETPHAHGGGAFAALNTVIGKMSGVIQDPAVIQKLGLATLAPGFPRAILVEAFNRILVTAVPFPGHRRGISVFEEKTDLLPFEEAKLYGHNAVHALLAYEAARKGLAAMSEIRNDGELMDLGRLAFAECGSFLIKKHKGVGDKLFTPAGFGAYAEDLLERMTNPFLHDEVARIARDPIRKLSPGDRLLGTMAEALRLGFSPNLMARGTASAILFLLQWQKENENQIREAGLKLPGSPKDFKRKDMSALLKAIWKEKPEPSLLDALEELVWDEWTRIVV